MTTHHRHQTTGAKPVWTTYTDDPDLSGFASAAALQAEIDARKNADIVLQASIDDILLRLSKLETAGQPPVVIPPPPAGQQLVYKPIPPTPAPAYLVPTTDPTWGTKITQITQTNQRHAYATMPALNADGSTLLEYTVAGVIGGPCSLLDGNTYAKISTIAPWDTMIWSSVDPDRLYATRNKNELIRLNRVGTVTSVLAGLPAGSILGAGEGSISDDDSLVVATGNGRIITIDPRTGTKLGDIAQPVGFDNAKPSHSGRYIVVVANNVTVYNSDLSNPRVLWSYGNHGDCAVDTAGDDVFVMNNANGVRSFRLKDSWSVQQLPTGTAFEYGHVSGRNHKRPGWAYLSVRDSVTTSGRAGCDQVVALRLDGTGTVEVYGFAHHGGDSGSAADYVRQPHAVPSPNGKKVLFASEWGGSIHDYIAEL